jgi:hypothetical protein
VIDFFDLFAGTSTVVERNEEQGGAAVSPANVGLADSLQFVPRATSAEITTSPPAELRVAGSAVKAVIVAPVDAAMAVDAETPARLRTPSSKAMAMRERQDNRRAVVSSLNRSVDNVAVPGILTPHIDDAPRFGLSFTGRRNLFRGSRWYAGSSRQALLMSASSDCAGRSTKWFEAAV